METKKIIEKYFDYFNSGNRSSMVSLLHPDVVHEINQGGKEVGHSAFIKFMSHMDDCYKENLTDIVVMTPTESSPRASAEYIVNGTYLKTDGSLPPAKNQKYTIKAGSFFEFKDNKISRITTYYNLPEWVNLVMKA